MLVFGPTPIESTLLGLASKAFGGDGSSFSLDRVTDRSGGSCRRTSCRPIERKLKAVGKKAMCVACHPGYSSTNIQGRAVGFAKITGEIFKALFAHPPEQGALPSALSAAGVEAKRGGYYGAQKTGEYRGPISDALVAPYALDETLAARLWEMSEELVAFNGT